MTEREGLNHGCPEGKAGILTLCDVPSQIVEECYVSGQMSHALHCLHLVYYSKHCIVLLFLRRVQEMLLVTSPVAGWCCQAYIILFTVPFFPTWLISVNTPWWSWHVLLLMESICFPFNPL